jgi:cyclopropane fatty-acyl-phospholipid synthase-like methyltransferase
VTVLPDATVSPAVYDEKYYLTACQGYEAWNRSGGSEPAGLYLGLLHEAGITAGERLVDIGAGRGELIAAAAAIGADATGIEYADSAIGLAAKTLAAQGNPVSARMLRADARQIPLGDGCADVVTMIDVIEHLSLEEQHGVLAEAHRVLAPGGRILIHTMPNRLIYDVTYKLLRAGRKSWPADPRNDYERQMHVGEQTARSIRARLREAGFEKLDVTHGRMVYDGYLPTPTARRLHRGLARVRLTAPLTIGDLWGRAIRP